MRVGDAEVGTVGAIVMVPLLLLSLLFDGDREGRAEGAAVVGVLEGKVERDGEAVVGSKERDGSMEGREEGVAVVGFALGVALAVTVGRWEEVGLRVGEADGRSVGVGVEGALVGSRTIWKRLS